ncbi:hypothetical protein K0M31_014094 [Melipona bicolor]|uniref:Uncharacterized protein n=1 Tax=Melipona bicolor TaxID=60889 RepID=A0AA40G832_9HYME|nr:hypothetical protein K0M31_014094 [Melipona bicolor]
MTCIEPALPVIYALLVQLWVQSNRKDFESLQRGLSRVFSLEIESEVEVDCGNGDLQQVNRSLANVYSVHDERPSEI